MSNDDEARRREINMFAAMANDEYNSGTFNTQASLAIEDIYPYPTPAHEDPTINLFSQASMAEDPTGTFTLQDSIGTESSQDYSVLAKNQNLEAAAAALDEDETPGMGASYDRQAPPDVFMSKKPAGTPYPEKFPKLDSRTPMHSQQLQLPKSLFFGHELPPRVIKEARDILNSCPKDRPFPPDVKNLISTIRAYGHGFDLLREDSKSSPYVTIFCPKWSESSRILFSQSQSRDDLSEGKDPDHLDDIDFSNPTSTTVTNDQSSGGGTLAGQATGEEGASSFSVDANRNSERDLFSLWAGGDDVALRSPRSSPSSDTSLPRSSLIRDNSGGSQSSIGRRKRDDVMSDRDMFSQWARGDSVVEGASHTTMSTHGSSAILSGNSSMASRQLSTNKVSGSFSGTFMNLQLPSADNSDDDEIVVSEMKKKVGMNEHLNAALAYLEEDKDEPRIDSAAVEDSVNRMSSVALTPDGGRALTNHELMNGVAPLFGCDDPSLPTEADLGIHETRDEQQRSREQRRNQAIIENYCPQNIFESLSCPSSASNPEDNHSWTSRSSPSSHFTNVISSQQGDPRTTGHPELGVLPEASVAVGRSRSVGRKMTSSVRASSSASSTLSKVPHLSEKRFDPRLRYGWWNVPEEDETAKVETDGFPDESVAEIDSTESQEISSVEDKQRPLVLPPHSHPATNVLVHMGLEPTPEKLQEQNRPLFQLHPATTVAQSLPFLSDRPPSYRFLQIDTQAVGFLGLGGEVEPLFCSLAIYHVETIGPNALNDSSFAPIPDLQRCGKVTETLSFDVVSDQSIQQRCRRALWPIDGKPEEMSQGTRCGVFPLPSNLNIHNLYAILIVHKVVSAECDFEPYLATGSSDDPQVDLESLRQRAEKACIRQGNFITPFAFGVAPLLQVFGADIPIVPSSRAVQIPLFQFSSNQGERQIIDHIMVMLYPRADHNASGIGGPAPVTNKGTAMLVMRNFGYLGLHSVVHSKSSLARDRLVDFTRETQLRRRIDDEAFGDAEDTGLDSNVTPAWHKGFIAEPTVDGGRNRSYHIDREHKEGVKLPSPLYAQELAPLRLHASPLVRSIPSLSLKSQRGRSHHVSGDDIEPYFHTSFCNEMLCYPRLLHNCPGGNIVMKVELREIEWVPEYGTLIAHLPTTGPAIHNSRRGPHIVQASYTSCSIGAVDPFFFDEFKFRLPLVLDNATYVSTEAQRQTAILFIVYRLSFDSRTAPSQRFGSGEKMDSFAGEKVGESDVDSLSGEGCNLTQLCCGYLPITQNASIIPDGNHDVRMTHIAYHPPQNAIQDGKFGQSVIILGSILGTGDGIKVDPEGLAGDSASAGTGLNLGGESGSVASGSESLAHSENSDISIPKGNKNDPICLQVRIAVHSSVHAQNATLDQFLRQGSDVSTLEGSRVALSKMLQLSRDDLLQRSSLPLFNVDSSHEAERLQTSVVDLANASMCPVSGVSDHLIRTVTHLWRAIVVGCGEPNPQWANPGAFLPLRVQAFATLLQVLGSTSVYFSKRGLSQLDGSGKSNLILLGRILALAFDEEDLFGENVEEALDERFQSYCREPTKIEAFSDRRRKHVRSRFEFSDEGGDSWIRSDFVGNYGGLDPRIFPSKLLSTSPSEDKATARTLRDDKGFGTLIPSGEESMKMDSVTDFRNALKAGYGEVDEDAPIYDGSQSGSKAAMALVKAFSGPQGMNRRWMTAPAQGLATIREDTDDGADEAPNMVADLNSAARKMMGPLDCLDTELVVKAAKSPVKQMRVPKLTVKTLLNQSEAGEVDKLQVPSAGLRAIPLAFSESIRSEKEKPSVVAGSTNVSDDHSSRNAKHHKRLRSTTLPSTDAEIQEAGSSFLDAVELSLGLGLGGLGEEGTPTREDDQVGKAHHRKTKSHCSIDWSIPNDDIGRYAIDTSMTPPGDVDQTKNKFSDSMTTLSDEKGLSIKLPIYIDRLMALKREKPMRVGRWFPFTYEVIILQWVGVLNEQRKSEPDGAAETALHDMFAVEEDPLADAASRSTGVAIACAPVLFEIIKQSLGWRIANICRRTKDNMECARLVTLDASLMTSLERIIESISLACIDFRNFDAWETRQTCIDVNDSVVWFLRDMFGFLDPDCAYRLVAIYLSNLLSTTGKLEDRDSSTGLRCSWEVTKLQLNALSAFVRFPDLVRINSPQFNSLDESLFRVPGFTAVVFFDDMLLCYEKLQARFLDESVISVPVSKDLRMRPHWLVEIITDVCLLGTEHVEQNIQRRSSSLLLEMFWTQSQESTAEGNSSIIASMHVTFLEKVLARTDYLSKCFSSKNQVRQDILRCTVFVLQSAPGGLLRALWRKLGAKSTGRGRDEKYGGVGYSAFSEFDNGQENQHLLSRKPSEWKQEANLFEMFSLINLALASFEFEGTDENARAEGFVGGDNPWQKEYLSTMEFDTPAKVKQRRLMHAFGKSDPVSAEGEGEYATTSSRRWHAHDGTLVLIKTAQQIVREIRNLLETSEECQSFLNPARTKLSSKHRQKRSTGPYNSAAGGVIRFSYIDTVMFVRAASSVYLHALTLEQSDITLVTTLNASLELVKIFGIKLYNQAVGETLQHWMRVVTFHCGSRRAEVRVQASDFLEFLLRSTWDSFGSFFRVRLPFLAIQTEVMEKIVATAAGRHYREQRMMGLGMELFTNGSAEASLAPLWRTLDRLHHQSASQNIAFRSALVRLAEKVKKLFRAYIAAHALAFLQQANSPTYFSPSDGDFAADGTKNNLEAQTSIRASKISIYRVINASAGYSKQFLGFDSASVERSAVGHSEAVEDAFLAAADVFSPTELPNHRVAWLRKLANFHSGRRNYAEEATCHYHIHITLQHASRLHGTLWFSTPFLPWTKMRSDGINVDGGDDPITDDHIDDPYDNDFVREIEKTSSFRRIFYRNENSLRVAGGELEAGISKFAFYGVTLPLEYNTVSPWTSMREMEASMLEEAEAAAELFLKSGIVASSRYAWSLAVRHYSDKFCYGKLRHVYDKLARTVITEVPSLDLNQQEISVTVPLGRFYRVWFHGGAPDELIGAEFVYRTASTVKLEQFGEELTEVIRCICPDNTPIHLVLDGRVLQSEPPQTSTGFRMGAQLEPVRVKVTPVRPMMWNSGTMMRGLPEWFHDYIESAFEGQPRRSSSYSSRKFRRSDSIYSESGGSDTAPRPRHHASSSQSTSGFSTTANSAAAYRWSGHVVGGETSRRFQNDTFEDDLLVADKFSFMQPINQARDRGAKDWLRGSSGDFTAKSLRVTQLQVGQAFPACVSRQAVVHRVVFTQSPIEAANDSIYQWCAILFRTAVATNGQAILGTNTDPGIGIDAAKVVSDSIHSSRVKEMGLYLLKTNVNFEEEDELDALESYDRLSEDEVGRLQLRLARSIVVFMELLHIMIARNREMLLLIIQDRKKDESASRHSHSTGLVSLSDVRSTRSALTRQGSLNGNDSRVEVISEKEAVRPLHGRKGSGFVSLVNDDVSIASALTTDKARSDAAIAIQSELQRSFISLCKEIQPRIHAVVGSSESPRWLKLCAQDNYFSAYIYRNVKIPMEEELDFDGFDDVHEHDGDESGDKQAASSAGRSHSSHDAMSYRSHASGGGGSAAGGPGSPEGSLCSESFASPPSSDAGRSHQSSKRSMTQNRGVV